MMAIKDTTATKKRKQSIEEDVPVVASLTVGDLEMLSDEENDEAALSDDGHIDEFPEIDTRSDSDNEDSEGSDFNSEDEEEDKDEGEEEDGLDSDDSEIRIFPKAKTIVSDITGHPKIVYPEIEPNYDSDSSTEDVSLHPFYQVIV